MKCECKRFRVFVLCSSEQNSADWRAHSTVYPQLEIVALYPVVQAWRVVRELIETFSEPILLCQEDIRFGLGLHTALPELVEELDAKYPGWGACGNRGCSWSGSPVYDYTRDVHHSGLQTALCPRSVFSIGDSCILLNCAAFHRIELAVFKEVRSLAFALPLSLECLNNGLALLVDPRLMTLRTGGPTTEETSKLVDSAEFRRYYSERFVNHVFPFVEAPIDMASCIDYAYVSQPEQSIEQRDLILLFERALARSRRTPSVTLCCRTQFKRPELLRRAVRSFAAAELESGKLLDLRITLLTDRDAETLAAAKKELRAEFANLQIEWWQHTIRPPRYSRTDLLIAAIERAQTDYIWFVDDDDYVLPGAVTALSRTVLPAEPVLHVGNSLKMEEVWAGSPRLLEDSTMAGRFEGRNIFRILSGSNYIPVCNVLFPIRETAQVLAGKRALGDYNEDYFTLLLTLTSGRVEVELLEVDLCGISFRGEENTVNEADRAKWHLSYATFVQEALTSTPRNPFLWQLANESNR